MTAPAARPVPTEAPTSTPVLLWVDVETTGLRSGEPILEVGLRTTDASLNTLAEAAWVMPYTDVELAEMRDGANPFVQEMHDTSGLWGDCLTAPIWGSWTRNHIAAAGCAAGAQREGIRDEIVQWIRANAPGRLPLAGSSVRMDRTWLTHLAPELDAEDLIHYRIVDVSSVRILAQMWRPELLDGEPTGQGKHRVMPDLDDSIELLRYYRTRIFGGAA